MCQGWNWAGSLRSESYEYHGCSQNEDFTSQALSVGCELRTRGDLLNTAVTAVRTDRPFFWFEVNSEGQSCREANRLPADE